MRRGKHQSESAPLQITRFVYGADVLDKAGDTISRHNGWIKAVHYPDPDTGRPSELPSLRPPDLIGN